MKTRFEATSSPSAGPRRSSTRSGTCSPRRSTRAGRVRRWSCSTRWAGRAPTSPRSTSASAREASAALSSPTPTARPCRPDPRVDPLRRRRPQDGSRRVHRARRARAGISHLSRFAAHGVGADGTIVVATVGHGGRRGHARERTLPRHSRPRDRRDHQPACQAGRLGGLVRARQRRGARARPRRPLGALQGPRRRQPGRHDDTAEGAQARRGRLQRRGQGRAGDRGHRAGLLRVSGRAAVRLGPVRDDRPALHRPAPDRGHDAAGQPGEVRPLPGAVPDDDRRRARARTRFPSGRSTARRRSSSPRRTGSTTATAAAGWPCSTSACPATSSPTAR